MIVALTPVEAKELTSWITHHLNKCATHGADIIIAQETGGIGIKTTVKCVDGSEHDITDYTRW